MSDAAHSNVLRRKASVGQKAKETEGLSPARALRLSLARAAGDLWELPLTVTGVRHELIGLDEVQTRLPAGRMTLLLDGPDGVRGGLSVDRALLSSVIEVQTLGQVAEREAAERGFTSTDAALFAPLLDTLMERVDILLSGRAGAQSKPDGAWIMGYRFGAMVEDPRTLSLALEGQDYHLMALDVDVAAGMRRGEMILCLPESFEPLGAMDDEGGNAPGAFAESMSMVSTDLSVTLPKLTVSLSQATALKVGDTLPVTPNALSAVQLRGSDGEIIARGRLGQVSGMRALRLKGRVGSGIASAAPHASFEDTMMQMDATDGPASSLPHLDAPGTDVVPSGLPMADPNDGLAPLPPMDDMAGGEALPDLPPMDFDTEDLPDLPPMDFTD
ncbi:FliM/FliN family flagellar motor switch protein [Roseobacteraceae bacterium S113]